MNTAKHNIQLSAVEDHDGILTIRGGGARKDWNGIHYKQGMSAKNVGTTKLSTNIATTLPGVYAAQNSFAKAETLSPRKLSSCSKRSGGRLNSEYSRWPLLGQQVRCEQASNLKNAGNNRNDNGCLPTRLHARLRRSISIIRLSNTDGELLSSRKCRHQMLDWSRPLRY
jgi:hypothetical protein